MNNPEPATNTNPGPGGIQMTIKKLFHPLALSLIIACSSLPGFALAEVVCSGGLNCTQTIRLTPGWNAIHVKVAPVNDATGRVFADFVDGSGAQISSVWTWLAQRAKVDFIQDPDAESMLSAPGWLRYFPPAAPQAFLSNLFAVQANRAYLVKLESSSEATLSITGRPAVPRINWQPGEFSLTGFHVDPANPPVFSDFLAGSPAHAGQSIYRLVGDQWQQVNPSNTVIDSDTAYWVFSDRGSNFVGPMDIDLPQVDRMEFGTVLEQLTLKLENSLDVAHTATLQLLGGAPGIFYANPDPVSEQSWLPLGNGLAIPVGAEGESRVPLGVRRADFEPDDFGQTLEVKSTSGARWLIPVTASAPQLNSLWVGTVTIDQVSQVHNYLRTCTTEPTTLEPIDADGDGTVDVEAEAVIIGSNPGSGSDLCTDAEGFPVSQSSELGAVAANFSFRVIMHRESGQVRLLKDVIQMRADDGRYVLLTDDSLVPNFRGAVLRDGELVGRRMSTMAYDFAGDTFAMAGGLDSVLTADIMLAADAPTNPFRHYYHADHGGDGYEVTRRMEFTFGSVGEGLGANYDVKQGTYREVISGLHKEQIVAAGSFTLRHAAQIDTLNQ
ncbi:hypothetical protein MSSD14B_33490 [Marinobacter salsuginis]|uniref:Uncharacterized protein n=2 Tax=Marinobacter salsuginis TaxID=418719 RepID=A0A5M3Q3U0_9GAMM|nr:hypothetical protein MSSD14B_33490 [Marinobacter salsuginis]